MVTQTKHIGIRIPLDQVAELEAMAAQNKKSVSGLVKMYVEMGLTVERSVRDQGGLGEYDFIKYVTNAVLMRIHFDQ